MNKEIPKRNKCNRHPSRHTGVSRIKGKPRQRIRQVLRDAIPREEVEKITGTERTGP